MRAAYTFCIFLIVLIAAPIGSAQATEKKWREVKRFSGSGATRTADFVVTSPTWRIRYIATPTDREIPNILLSVTAQGAEMFLAINETQPGKGESYGKKPGKYWLEVNSLVCTWHLLVEEESP